MSHAVASPRNRPQALVLDGATVHLAATVRAILEAAQGVADVLQHGPLGIVLAKPLFPLLVARSIRTRTAVARLVTGRVGAPEPSRELPRHGQQLPLDRFQVHTGLL